MNDDANFQVFPLLFILKIYHFQYHMKGLNIPIPMRSPWKSWEFPWVAHVVVKGARATPTPAIPTHATHRETIFSRI